MAEVFSSALSSLATGSCTGGGATPASLCVVVEEGVTVEVAAGVAIAGAVAGATAVGVAAAVVGFVSALFLRFLEAAGFFKALLPVLGSTF